VSFIFLTYKTSSTIPAINMTTASIVPTVGIRAKKLLTIEKMLVWIVVIVALTGLAVNTLSPKTIVITSNRTASNIATKITPEITFVALSTSNVLRLDNSKLFILFFYNLLVFAFLKSFEKS